MLPILTVYLLCPAPSPFSIPQLQNLWLFLAGMLMKLISPMIVAPAYFFSSASSLLYKYQFPTQESLSVVTTAI